MRSIVVGTAGHIDHGKSALVRALTGIDPDRLKEEKARGITIDLGFAHASIGDVTFAFVDVPGHERFVKNMLAGIGGIDCALLVVAADESVMPQTREHFAICRLLRVPAGAIALTKADLVDRETIELVRLETKDLVAGTFMDAAPIVAVSSKTGEGLVDLQQALEEVARVVGARASDGPVRLPIDRVFSMKGFGTVITGTLGSGEVAVEDELSLLPRGRRVKVRGVQVHGRKEGRGRAGQRVALNLGGIEVAEIGRGDVLATPGAFEGTRVIDAVAELLADARPMRHGARVRFHHGTSELLGRVALAGPAAGAVPQATLAEAPPGASAYVRLRLETPAVLTRGDRFILRAYSPPVTIGGGQVLDPKPPRAGIRTAAGRARFAKLRIEAAASRQPAAGSTRQQATGEVEAAEDRAIETMIEESGASGMAVAALSTRAGVAPRSVQATIERLSSRGRTVRAGDVLVPAAVLSDLEGRLVEALTGYHLADPLAEGMPREEARERLFARADPAVFERAIADLTAAAKIVARDRLALATHRLTLSTDEERARQAIEHAFREGGLKPPDVSQLAAASGVAPATADRIVNLLLRQKVLTKVDALLFHQEALQRLKAEVAALKAPGGAAELDVAHFKERYGITRKFAIPLLEYLDRERITRRVGERRVVI